MKTQLGKFAVDASAVLDPQDVRKLLQAGSVVRHTDGSVCLVTSYDKRMASVFSVVFRRLGTGAVFEGTVQDITGIMVPVDCDAHKTTEANFHV